MPKGKEDLRAFADQQAVLPWEFLDSLKRFSKLSNEGKEKILLGASRFTVCMFDIEATHLTANVGRIICCSFKPLDADPYTFTALDKKFRRADVYDDSALAIAIRDELERFDIIVGWNSRAFDVKYINARCMRVGERTKRAQYHVDGMWSWRTKARAWSGLAAVQQFVGAETEKTTIDWRQWARVLGWNKELRDAALAEIVDHCERDVTVLEQVYRLVVNAGAVRGLRVDGGIL